MDVLSRRDWQRLDLARLIDQSQSRSHGRATRTTGNERQVPAVRDRKMRGSGFAGGCAPDTFDHRNWIAFQFELLQVERSSQNSAAPREDDVPGREVAGIARTCK